VEPPKLSFAGRARYWLPAVAWAIVISAASTDLFSSEHTGQIIIPILHSIFPGAAAETLAFIHHLIRKSAHFTEYFLLSFLLLRAIREGRSGWKLRWALTALAIAAMCQVALWLSAALERKKT
jgi:VanZ family protein